MCAVCDTMTGVQKRWRGMGYVLGVLIRSVTTRNPSKQMNDRGEHNDRGPCDPRQNKQPLSSWRTGTELRAAADDESEPTGIRLPSVCSVPEIGKRSAIRCTCLYYCTKYFVAVWYVDRRGRRANVYTRGRVI
jgi:hypothetical protein